MKVWHVATVTFRQDTSSEKRGEILTRMQNLGKDCGGTEAGILIFEAGENVDKRRKVDLVEISLFKDRAAFEAFRVHPTHRAFADDLKLLADWTIGDIERP